MLNVITEIPWLKLVLMIMASVVVLAVVGVVALNYLLEKVANEENNSEMESYEMEAYHTNDQHNVGEGSAPAN